MHAIRFRAFGSTVQALVDAAGGVDPVAMLGALPLRAARVDRALSRFRSDSELSRLNRHGVAEDASDELLDGIETALAVAALSGGLVTPMVHDALVAAGYSRSFASGPALGAPARAATPRAVADWRTAVIVERGARRVRSAGALDVGGTAKGAFADDSVAWLSSSLGPTLIDAGGDIAVSGPRRNGEAWIVEVAAPGEGDAVLARVALGRGGVATSGRDLRRWEGVHHIIDPRTGAPAVSDVLTATVIAGDALTAEVLAKMVFLRGVRDGLRLIEERGPAVAALVVDDGSREHRSSSFRGYVRREPPSARGRAA